MIHELHLDPAPFAAIAKREKTVEMRLFDEKRRRISPGDTLHLIERGTGKSLAARVVALHRFPTFCELYKAIPHLALGYPRGVTGDPADMEAYYSEEEQKAFGVVGIEISL
ncbi:MAG: RNA-binding protein [Clostridia bacterium]|nr:RNA-binding protein [Clostridia bacterium]